jgi:hypothetical protein
VSKSYILGTIEAPNRTIFVSLSDSVFDAVENPLKNPMENIKENEFLWVTHAAPETSEYLPFPPIYLDSPLFLGHDSS